ncbi:hypothetical protein FPRO05_00045 [Fusarium proliferatum]|uniref:Uncharacterized protein n=1 Tax=Gibberella intermedia TaxID=948311 RepID=A0A365NLV5_GIBIN|nr:hypothetical protein FPRO05_00045 [Fusarium proliferatum]
MPAKRMRGTKLLAGMEQENMFTGPDMGSHGTRNQTRLQMNSLEGQTDAGGEENGAVGRGSDSSLSATRSVTPPEHSQTVNRVEDLESPQNVFDTQSIDVLESDDGMSMDMGDGFHLLEDQGLDLTQTINLPGTHQPQELDVEQLLAEVAALKQQIASLRQHSQQQIALQHSKPASEPRALPASGSDASELGSLMDTPPPTFLNTYRRYIMQLKKIPSIVLRLEDDRIGWENQHGASNQEDRQLLLKQEDRETLEEANRILKKFYPLPSQNGWKRN